MKRILAYGGHLLAATFAVPWLSMLAGGLIYGIFRPFLTSINTPQQLLSEHLIFLAVVVGASLAYSVSGKFTGTSALWVWIPATTVFVLRVLDWRANGSVLVGSGSFIEHFFTANCQIQNWREGGFESRCFDRLYLTPLFAGSLAYSAGAAIHRVVHYRDRPRDGTATRVAALPGQLQIVATPVAAVLALAITASSLGNQFHAEVKAQPSSWQWLGSGVLSTWLVVIVNIAMWGAIYLIGIGFARAPFRKDEKALFMSFMGSLMLIPVSALLPRISGIVHYAETMLSLTAFLAALTILLSLRHEH
jgi:hypothetical protein